jgi:hypothetical protein
MYADIDDDGTCPWLVRDRQGWRQGVLFTASADLLITWYSTSQSMPRHTWATANHRYGILVQRVRRARLCGDVDDLEQACQALLHHTEARPASVPLIRDAFAQLRVALALVAAEANVCLIGCDTCQYGRGRGARVRSGCRAPGR